MPKVTITGIPGADGEFILDLGETFSNDELRTIKRMSGVRAGEIQEAIDAGDNDLAVALTLIGLKRVGKIVPEQALWDAKADCIQWENTPEEKAAAEEEESLPPGSAPPDGANDNSTPIGTGDSSRTTPDSHQENVPSGTGEPTSPTGSTLRQVISAS